MTKPLNKDEKELRDRIAIEAMKSVITAIDFRWGLPETPLLIAKDAYEVADAMLKERIK